jgi:hypothetical protein
MTPADDAGVYYLTEYLPPALLLVAAGANSDLQFLHSCTAA